MPLTLQAGKALVSLGAQAAALREELVAQLAAQASVEVGMILAALEGHVHEHTSTALPQPPKNQGPPMHAAFERVALAAASAWQNPCPVARSLQPQMRGQCQPQLLRREALCLA